MRRHISFGLAMLAIVTTVACARNPAAPSATGSTATLLAGSDADMLAAKPGKPGSGSQPLTVAFSGGVSGVAATVQGTISGAATSGNLASSASGRYSLTVNAVTTTSLCSQSQVDSLGLLGVPLTGDLTLTVTQSANDVLWELRNITGKTWRLWARSRQAAPTEFTGSTNGASVTVTDGKLVVVWGGGPKGQIGCDASYTLTIMPVPPA